MLTSPPLGVTTVRCLNIEPEYAAESPVMEPDDSIVSAPVLPQEWAKAVETSTGQGVIAIEINGNEQNTGANTNHKFNIRIFLIIVSFIITSSVGPNYLN